MAIKSPFNYIGNKFRVLESIQAFFPVEINTFLDLFCGGCDVCVNTQAEVIYANDINYHVIGIIEEFQKHDTSFILKYIDETICEWGLSKTDERAFKAFRDYYNETKKPLDLFVLMCFSFNYQFRFNSNHDYNNTFGKNRSCFTKSMRSNLELFKKKIDIIHFSSFDFHDYDYSFLHRGDFVYADPPYLLSCGAYNDGKRGFRGWTPEDDFELMHILTSLSVRGVHFALSNVIEHKGKTNDALIKWAESHGYHIHEINVDYNNCNYHTNNRANTTQEILITNY